MSSNRTLMVLPGDGVGPEVVNETLRVVDWLAKNKNISFNIKEDLLVELLMINMEHLLQMKL